MRDETVSFDVTVLEVEQPSRVVLFAVGGSGNPERHGPLLTALAERGCSGVAPHFERMVSPVPTDDDLLLRVRRLKLALDAVARSGANRGRRALDRRGDVARPRRRPGVDASGTASANHA